MSEGSGATGGLNDRFGAAVEGFVAAQRSERTGAAYRRDLGHLSEFLGTSSEPVEAVLGRLDLEAYRDWLGESGYGVATIRRRLSAATSFMRWAGVEPGTVPAVERPPAPRSSSLGLDDVVALISGVRDPAHVTEGVAALLFASRSATVDGLLALGPEHLGRALRITIDGVEIQFPRSMRATLEVLVRGCEGGRLFRGMSRQTLTRRMRLFGEQCGVADCTPRSLRRASGQVVVEALAAVEAPPTDPARLGPQQRLDLIADAVRHRLDG